MEGSEGEEDEELAGRERGASSAPLEEGSLGSDTKGVDEAVNRGNSKTQKVPPTSSCISQLLYGTHGHKKLGMWL